MIKPKTIRNDLEYLRQKSKNVDFKDEMLEDEIKMLREYCITSKCFALAAIQLGIPKRLIYIRSMDMNIKDTLI